VGNGGIVSLVNGAFYGASPVDGVQQVTFNSGDGPTGGSIFQTFSTTVGQTYAVGFYIGRASLGSGTMSLHASVTASGGQVLAAQDAAGPASPGYGPAQTFIFTATSTSSTLTFTDISSATVAVDVLLDNVSVTPSSPSVGPFTNGSFESPALTAGGGQVLPVGSTEMTGWTVGGTGGPVGLQNGPVDGVGPVDGAQHLAFNGGNTSPGTTIFQTFSTTVGQTYAVSFNVGRKAAGSGTMSLHVEVTASGGQVLGARDATGPASPGYGPAQTLTFIATTSSSTLTFKDTSSATVAVDLLLDNVSVAASSPAVGTFTNFGFELPALAAGGG